jgi:peptide-methionine (S)-S-oxide reductase
LPGVVRTRVGYAGGSSADPTYRDIGDHAETIQVDYDPAVISYEDLLRVFWGAHSPTSRPWSSQYASIIFTHDEEQQRLAEQTRDAEAAQSGGRIYTEIVPYERFFLAEAYHQKYRLQQWPELLAELRAVDPRAADLLTSTTAARLNGYLGGNGDLAGLQAEMENLGLEPAAQERLLALLADRER